MECYIVTEYAQDEALLRKLLPVDFLAKHETDMINGTRPGSATSLAISIGISRRRPVILVANSLSSNEEGISDRRQSHEELINLTLFRKQYRIVMAVPELEIMFFENEEWLRRHIPKITEELFIRGQYTPRKILEQLLGKKYHEKLLASLTEEDIATLRKSPIVRELEKAVTDLLRVKAA